MTYKRSFLDEEINSSNYGFESVVRDSLILDGMVNVSEEEKEAARVRMRYSERAREESRRDFLDYEI